MNSKNTHKAVFRVRNIKENAHQKNKNTYKKHENANVVRKITNVVSSEKGTAETLKCCSFSQRMSKNTQVLFLFAKEQQKHARAVPFRKGTTKNTQVLFLFEKEQQSHTSAVPFRKGTAKSHKCCSISKRNSKITQML
jgi:hypothetical protein